MAADGRTLEVPSDRSLWITGAVALRSAFGLTIVLCLLIAWKKPEIAPFLPVLPLVSVAGWSLFRRPLANLAVVMSLFVLIANFEEGIQITEVLYGLYFIGFLGHWFITRLVLGGGRVFDRLEDTLLFAFLVLITCTIPLTIAFNGSLGGVVSEMLSFSMLALYYPIKESVAERENGLRVVLGAMMFVGAFVLIRNFFNYQEIIASATYAWQVTRGRAVTNEALLMVPAFFCLAGYVSVHIRRLRWASAAAFVLFFAGIILTQSRGYWIALLFGAGILFLIIPWKGKVRLLATALLAGVGAFAIGVYMFGDFFILILTGIFDRFLSIATAIVNDASLQTRFNETAAVWEHIRVNPILGYGMGVSYTYYDFTAFESYTRAFIHNGYASLWFKFGIWGLGIMLVFLGAIVRRSWSVYRSVRSSPAMKATALAIIGSFAGFALSTITSNPFFVNDGMFIIAVLCGLSGGLFTRLKRSESPDG